MRDLNTPLNIAVMISGTGSNMVAIIEAIQQGRLNAEVKMVVASNPRAKGIMKASAAALPVAIFQPSDYDDPEFLERKLVALFQKNEIDYVVMAGYMRKVTPILLNAYPNRVINLHPALLPKHKGAHAIQDAWDAGDKVTGITIHLANKEYDEGPIIYQREVPVLEGDTIDDLEARIHKAEHEAYPYVLQKLAQDKIHLYGHSCVIDD